jgi:Spy/CpxP family protein refolding chaperone
MAATAPSGGRACNHLCGAASGLIGMNMKLPQFTLIAVVMLGGWLACGGAAIARNAKHGAARAYPELNKEPLAQELNLTADQQQQLRPILQEEAQKLKALRTNTGLNRAQKHQQLRTIHQETQARIKPILTPQQLAKWQQLRLQARLNHRLKT